MALSASQIPIKHWPIIACTYMHLRVAMARRKEYSIENPVVADQYASMVVAVSGICDFKLLKTTNDLIDLKEYLCNLLQEFEETLE